MKEFTVRICGEAGQGVQTVGQALCSLYKNRGLNIFANQDYMSRIRGGNNFFQLRVADSSLYASRQRADIIVALDKNSIDAHHPSLSKGGFFIVDKKKLGIQDERSSFFDIPLYEMASTIGGGEIFVNAAALGAVAAMTAVEINYAVEILKNIFSDKTEDIIAKNTQVAQAAYDFVKKSRRDAPFVIKNATSSGTIVMNGNDAIALGAIRAGCKFYSAYPMTPSTSIMNVLAHYAHQFNIVVEQAEDEIAAINMVIGASFAGTRAMTGTSGGGFCLMVEGISLAAMTETPVVMVDAQRPAPATGFPTRTEQADLQFVLSAGHGEFARAVFTPGSIEEAFYLTIKAFNIAEQYQIPVIIMTDQHLADSYRNFSGFDFNRRKVERSIISKQDSAAIAAYKRYALTPSGISPRAVPSWIKDVIYADSDEHTEEGHITESAAVRIAMVEKRLYKKMEGLSKEIEPPVSENLASADTILIGFGSTYGVLRDAAPLLKEKKIGFIHLPQVWPFPAEALAKLLHNAKKIITVENNASAQLAVLLRSQTSIKVSKSILRFDGRALDVDYLLEKIKEK